MMAETKSSGFLPNRSTMKSEEMLLSSCTNPTIIVAVWLFTELPAALKISTVKKITESMPLNCWTMSRTSPIPKGRRMVRRRKARSSNDLYFFGESVSLVDPPTDFAWKSANFNHSADRDASSYRFLLFSQTGDSGSKITATNSPVVTPNPIQASHRHGRKLPRM